MHFLRQAIRYSILYVSGMKSFTAICGKLYITECYRKYILINHGRALPTKIFLNSYDVKENIDR